MQNTPKTILITGGAGYIGSALAAAFVHDGHQVVVLDDVSTGQPELLPTEVTMVEGDVTSYADLVAVCSDYDFDTVVHCAAKKAVGESEADPPFYFYTNVAGSIQVLRAMEAFSIPHLVFSSTAVVYDQVSAAELLSESSPLNPPNVYGQTKLMVEQMIETFARLDKIKHYTIFRYFNVAGDAGLGFTDSHPQNVFPLIAHAVKSKSPFSIFGDDYPTKDGTGVRDYIHVNDLVTAHQQVIAGGVSGVFNLGTGVGYSVQELLAAFDAVLTAPVAVQVAKRRLGDPAQLVADASLAHHTFAWQPQHSLADMVTSTVAVYLTDDR